MLPEPLQIVVSIYFYLNSYLKVEEATRIEPSSSFVCCFAFVDVIATEFHACPQQADGVRDIVDLREKKDSMTLQIEGSFGKIVVYGHKP